jgi:hypothetical protein
MSATVDLRRLSSPKKAHEGLIRKGSRLKRVSALLAAQGFRANPRWLAPKTSQRSLKLSDQPACAIFFVGYPRIMVTSSRVSRGAGKGRAINVIVSLPFDDEAGISLLQAERFSAEAPTGGNAALPSQATGFSAGGFEPFGYFSLSRDLIPLAS